MVDPAAPDLDRYPRFAEAMAVAESGVLAPGDAIYIPLPLVARGRLARPGQHLHELLVEPRAQGDGQPYHALLLSLFALRTLPDDHGRRGG